MKPVPLSRLLSLAGRQLFRESRSELRVLFFALLIAVASSTAIGYFSARLNGAMLARAAEFLGADLVLNGTQPASAEQIERGTRLGLRHADSVEFSSVIATDQGIQLSSIKAVGDRYPARPAQERCRAVRRRAGRRSSAGGRGMGRIAPAGQPRPEGRRQHRDRPQAAAHRAHPYLRAGPRRRLLQPDAPRHDEPGRPRCHRVIQPGSRVRYRDLWEGRWKPSRPIASRSRAASPPTSACRMPATATARWAMPSAVPSAT